MLTTVENVAIAKKSYEAFYNTIKRNFYLTMQQISKDEKMKLLTTFGGKMFTYN